VPCAGDFVGSHNQHLAASWGASKRRARCRRQQRVGMQAGQQGGPDAQLWPTWCAGMPGVPGKRTPPLPSLPLPSLIVPRAHGCGALLPLLSGTRMACFQRQALRRPRQAGGLGKGSPSAVAPPDAILLPLAALLLQAQCGQGWPNSGSSDTGSGELHYSTRQLIRTLALLCRTVACCLRQASPPCLRFNAS
jgi:hypothetical protein